MKEGNTSGAKIVFWLLLLVFLWIVLGHIAKTEQILRVLASGRWLWIFLALLCQLLIYPYYTYFVRYVLKMFKVDLGFTNTLYMHLASKFTDIAVPISTVGQVAIYVRNAKKFNLSALDMGIGVSLVLLFEVSAFSLLSILTLITLFSFHQYQSYLLIPVFVLLIFVLGIIAVVIRTVMAKRKLSKRLTRFALFVARLFRIKEASRETIDTAIHEASNNLSSAGGKIWTSLSLAFGAHMINLLTLALIFLAFTPSFNFFAILTAYVTGLLFTIISVTPQGVGVAEAAMVAALHAFGVDLSAAAVITLAFRGLLYWLPLFVGFYAFSHLELKDSVR